VADKIKIQNKKKYERKKNKVIAKFAACLLLKFKFHMAVGFLL